MIEEMTEQEIDRLLEATNTVNYLGSDMQKCFLDKALQADDVNYTAGYVFNLGRIIERIKKSMGEEYENIPYICLDDIAAIIDIGLQKGHDPKKISDDLFDLIFAIQREAFRYGYYAALQNENVRIDS